MSSIEERVVGMKFDNAQFESGAKQTLGTLDSLNKSLKMEGATKGLHDVNAAAANVKLGHIAHAVDDIANRFKAAGVIAITALATIAHQAIATGGQIVKSLTFDPINKGLKEYETNLNSIQTILSNTQWQNTNLDQVNEALATLNTYSDQTIYNFGQMARNIGTFTAAGVKLDVATDAIKGIANLAAISGSSAEQASSAMYQLSQALATGTLKLIDWNSVVNAGMGGKVFQDSLMETARVHGVAIDEMIEDAGGFRGSLEKGWITSTILTETLAKFTGDLSEAQLLAMGYNEEQIAGILRMGKTAQDAATKVKTVSQLIGTLQEAAGSGWAKTWQLIFGDFEEAKELFTNVNNVIGGFIQTSADARNSVLEDWKELGGRTVLIEAIAAAFNVLMEVVHPIKLAFRDIFPAASGRQLYEITVALRDFIRGLFLGEDTMTNIRRTAAGFFAVLGIGWDILKQVGRVLLELFGMVNDGEGSFLEITANIGDFLVALRKAIQEGGGLITFFNGVRAVLSVPIKLLQIFTNLISEMFEGFDATKKAEEVAGFVQNLGPLGIIADFIVYAWERVLSTFDEIWEFFGPFAAQISAWFSDISRVVGGLDFASLLSAINTGALVGLVVVLRNSLGRGGLAGVLGQLTSTLSAMQTTLQATTLLQIALAVGVLAVSISILSNIDGDKLTQALAAIAVMFTQLIAALYVLSAVPSTNVAKLYVQAAAITVLAVAIDILAIAVIALSKLSWDEMLRGLAGVAVLLGSVVAAVQLMPAGGLMISTGVAITALALGIKILASAVKDLADLDWVELSKGLVGVAGLLGALGLFTLFAKASATGVLSGAGIVLLAAGIKILASAVMDLSSVSWENIGKGMATLATSLLLIGVALALIPPTAPLSAAGVAITAASLLILADAVQKISGISWENVGKGMAVLGVSLALITGALLLISNFAPTALLSAGAILLVAVAVEILADAMLVMGGMSWEEIARGLVVLAGALGIIVAALVLMPSALPGALALFIVANALTVLSAVLVTLGNMSWGEIIKGLSALALAFAVLGISAALLTPVLPAMFGLGAALLLIGAGLALAGAGVFLFATGLAALSVAGAGAAAAIVAIISAIIGMVPVIVQAVGVALLMLIDILIEAVPKIVELVLDILVQILQGIEDLAPVLEAALIILIDLLLSVLVDAIPKMAEAGRDILIAILKGIRDDIREIVTVALEIVQEFLGGIEDELPDVIQSGVDLILSFIRGLTDAINRNSQAMGDAGANLGIAIVNGMVRGLTSFGGRVSEAARNVAKNALNSALNFLGISSPSKAFEEVGMFSDLGWAKGVLRNANVIEKATEEVGQRALDSLRESLSGLNHILTSNIDTEPKITPVLDLSNVRATSGAIHSMLNGQSVSVNGSYSSARSTANDVENSRDDGLDGPDDPIVNQTNFYQYNNSPKALSTAEIYRNTNNQISRAKGVVTANANESGS